MLHAARRSETPSNGVDSIRSHGVSPTVDLSQKRTGCTPQLESDYIWKVTVGIGLGDSLSRSLLLDDVGAMG